MASLNRKNRDDRKAAGLTADQTLQGGATPDLSADVSQMTRSADKSIMGRGKRRVWVSVLVDVILLLVLAGLVVGGYFGYRAISRIYAPEWEQREVIFRVQFDDVDPTLLEEQYDSLNGSQLWSSEHTDADLLGTVVGVSEYKAGEPLVITVKAKAYYREGQGYRMGSTMLLAGSEGVYRMAGLTAEGTMISMHEVKDEPASTTAQ